LFALEHAEVFEQQAADICKERDRLAHQLKSLPGVTVYPSQANMMLLRLPGDDEAATRVFNALKAKKILVKNVSKMHPVLHHCLRITVGTSTENDQLLAALKEVLA
jgi:histidinol-phosphate aminotransferase